MRYHGKGARLPATNTAAGRCRKTTVTLCATWFSALYPSCVIRISESSFISRASASGFNAPSGMVTSIIGMADSLLGFDCIASIGAQMAPPCAKFYGRRAPTVSGSIAIFRGNSDREAASCLTRRWGGLYRACFRAGLDPRLAGQSRRRRGERPHFDRTDLDPARQRTTGCHNRDIFSRPQSPAQLRLSVRANAYELVFGRCFSCRVD